MKYLKLLFLIAFIFCLSTCKKESESFDAKKGYMILNVNGVKKTFNVYAYHCIKPNYSSLTINSSSDTLSDINEGLSINVYASGHEYYFNKGTYRFNGGILVNSARAYYIIRNDTSYEEYFPKYNQSVYYVSIISSSDTLVKGEFNIKLFNIDSTKALNINGQFYSKVFLDCLYR